LLKPFSDPSVFAVASRIDVPDPAKSHQETGKTRGRFENGMFYLWHDPVDASDEQRVSLPVFWAGGGACAVDRRRFRLIGGFDSLYSPFYVEDTDLSYQGWKRGWKSLFSPHSRVAHQHHGTSGPKFGEDYVSTVTRRNQFLFLWKNVTDFQMLMQHAMSLPRVHARAIRQFGARFEYQAYWGALARLPLSLFRRIANLQSDVLGDRDILNLTR
jgi:GT2 family glycosyltransferase